MVALRTRLQKRPAALTLGAGVLLCGTAAVVAQMLAPRAALAPPSSDGGSTAGSATRWVNSPTPTRKARMLADVASSREVRLRADVASSREVRLRADAASRREARLLHAAAALLAGSVLVDSALDTIADRSKIRPCSRRC